jgi:hypothetical protein
MQCLDFVSLPLVGNSWVGASELVVGESGCLGAHSLSLDLLYRGFNAVQV